MKNNEIDLHIHSNYSDGDLEVEQIFEKIKNEDIKYFSITDHDFIKGCKKIKSYIDKNIKFITGGEFSSIYKMHILGYFVNVENKELNSLIHIIHDKRKEKIIELMPILKDKHIIHNLSNSFIY